METTNIATVIAKLEARLGMLVLKAEFSSRSHLMFDKDQVYGEAASKAREIVDRVLRPLVDKSGEKSLDAYRFIHDREFVPASWMEDGRIPLELIRNPKTCVRVYNWESQAHKMDVLEEWHDIIVLLSHMPMHGDRSTVTWFLEKTRGSHPELYAEVLEELVNQVDRVVDPSKRNYHTRRPD